MNLSKTSEYSLRVLDLMASDNNKLFRANDIYDRLQIPFRYLKKLLTSLSKSDLIISVQGKNGGYRIDKKLSDISLLDIVKATGEGTVENRCFFGYERCPNDEPCAMHDKWTNIVENINDVLKSTSLADLKEIKNA